MFDVAENTKNGKKLKQKMKTDKKMKKINIKNL